MTAIADYAVSLPRYHITAEAYGDAVDRFTGRIERKSVTGYDEDAVTMGVAAARGVDAADPSLLAVATTTPPQPGATMAGPLARSLGLEGPRRTMTFGGSWKAGLEALDAAFSVPSGLAVASDDPRGDGGDPADHVLGAGAAAFATTDGGGGAVAERVGAAHYVDAQLPGKFERDGAVTDLGLGQYTVDGYGEAVEAVVEDALADAGVDTGDVAQVVLPQDDVKTSWRAGGRLGFESDQQTAGFVVNRVGFAGAAAPLVGFAAALDAADPGEYVLVAGYGYGHGATAFLFRTTDAIESASSGYREAVEATEAISYVEYRELAGGAF